MDSDGKIGDPASGGVVRQVGVEIQKDWMGLDIGPGTAAEFGDRIAEARTILWNGPMGVFEDERFAAGTKHVALCMADNNAALPLSVVVTVRQRRSSSILKTKWTMFQPVEGQALN